MTKAAQGQGFRRIGLATMFAKPRLVHHKVRSARWTLPEMTIAILADPHVCSPWLSPTALDRLVDMTNHLGADLILLPGDFIADRKMPGKKHPASEIAPILSRLAAPLGTWAVLGNHDWWDCPVARATRFTQNSVVDAFGLAGIPLLNNRATRLAHGGGTFLVAGFDSQRPLHGRPRRGFHKPELAFETHRSDEPAILLAHEPDYFAEADPRAFLQVSGHTHGGQMNLFGWRPLTPSPHGSRYAWGHMRDGERHLIVSGGVGYSGLPLRLFQPPELTLVTVTGTA